MQAVTEFTYDYTADNFVRRAGSWHLVENKEGDLNVNRRNNSSWVVSNSLMLQLNISAESKRYYMII